MRSQLTQQKDSVEKSFERVSPGSQRKSFIFSFLIFLFIIASLGFPGIDEDRIHLENLENKIQNRIRLTNQEKKDYVQLLWKVKGIRLFNCEENHIKEIGALTGYTPGPGDIDWRGTGKSLDEAIQEAFRRTGVPVERFEERLWAKDKLGKSRVVEWTSPDGAEVNLDAPHETNGPDVFHIGYQSEGKNRTRGHIFLDCLPYFREIR